MLNATSMSSKVERIIKEESKDKNIEGFIHSVFDYACNIQIPDKDLIGLISKEYGDNPYSISIDLPAKQKMKDLPIKQGMKVIINSRSISSIVGSLYFNLQDATIWDPSPPEEYNSLINKSQFENNIYAITRLLLEEGNFLGIGPLIMDYREIIQAFNLQDYQNKIKSNHYSLFISPRIKDLIYGIIKGDQELIKKLLVRIVGFGPGLTPSTDDLLVGLMAGLYYLELYHKKEIKAISHLKNSFDNKLISQTTIVSRQMLKAAIHGEFAKSIKELCLALISTDHKGKLENATLKAIDLGSTSGTDTLVGLLLGSYVVKELYL